MLECGACALACDWTAAVTNDLPPFRCQDKRITRISRITGTLCWCGADYPVRQTTNPPSPAQDVATPGTTTNDQPRIARITRIAEADYRPNRRDLPQEPLGAEKDALGANGSQVPWYRIKHSPKVAHKHARARKYCGFAVAGPIYYEYVKEMSHATEGACQGTGGSAT
jgi:hypothetical protein